METYVVASFMQFLVQGLGFWCVAELENFRCSFGTGNGFLLNAEDEMDGEYPHRFNTFNATSCLSHCAHIISF